MTVRQQSLLAAISQFRAEHGVSPTQTELAQLLHVSRTRVEHIVSACERKGLIARLPGKQRTLRVLASA